MANERGTNVTDMKRTYRTAIGGEFPDLLTMTFKMEGPLRYGENPNQPAGLYRIAGLPDGKDLAALTEFLPVKGGKGGMGAINWMDVSRGVDLLKYFPDAAVAVMKHNVPSGFATVSSDEAAPRERNTLSTIYRLARDADARSAYGSVVVMNRALDMPTAEEIMSTYVEVVAAPGYDSGTVDILGRRKDIRVVSFEKRKDLPKYPEDYIEGLYDVKMLPAGRAIVQKPYLTSIRGPGDLITDPMVVEKAKEGGPEKRYVVERDPTEREMRDLLTSWYVNLGVRSNGIVFVKDGVTVAVGSGQQERVGAIEQAIVKAYQKAMDREGIGYDTLRGMTGSENLPANPMEGAVMSSDAFFPFRDSIDTVARVGVTAVIQPGGSVRDAEVIQAVNEHGMAMAYTLERCFGHF